MVQVAAWRRRTTARSGRRRPSPTSSPTCRFSPVMRPPWPPPLLQLLLAAAAVVVPRSWFPAARRPSRPRRRQAAALPALPLLTAASPHRRRTRSTSPSCRRPFTTTTTRWRQRPACLPTCTKVCRVVENPSYIHIIRILLRYDTIRDAILTCARKPTRVSLIYRTHTHTHPFNGTLSGTTRVSRYQKDKTNLDFTEARDSVWQWHQMGHMQVCISLQTDNHTSTPPLSFLQAGCPSCRPANRANIK